MCTKVGQRFEEHAYLDHGNVLLVELVPSKRVLYLPERNGIETTGSDIAFAANAAVAFGANAAVTFGAKAACSTLRVLHAKLIAGLQ
eukprot:5650080-Pleurochrysis_carterae.AAC.1